MSANVLALGAIALWASLAALGVALSHVPPFLLTGLALLVGSVIALPLSRFDFRQWRVPLSTLAIGVYGLFGFHFLLFIALRHAPPVQANLVNYLWPLGIVVMAPLFLPGTSLTARHVLAALLGFAGAALAILGGRGGNADAVWAWGYIPALGSAFICAELGIAPTVRHADYIGAWLDVLKGDNRAIFQAASLASKAANFVMGRALTGALQPDHVA